MRTNPRKLALFGLIVLLFGLITFAVQKSEINDGPKAGKVNSQECTSLIRLALEDEVIAAMDAGDVGMKWPASASWTGEILISLDRQSTQPFTTKVLCTIPDHGWVIRDVTVFPDREIAAFWDSFSGTGPGLNIGFNCTHSQANCKIEEVVFETVRAAFCAWTHVQYELPSRAAAEWRARLSDARKRNVTRHEIGMKLMQDTP